MAQSATAQDGGLDSALGGGGSDWWGETLAADTSCGANGHGPDRAPSHREVAGSGAIVDFGIAEWTPYRRPWYRKTRVVAVIGAVVALAVTAVVLVVGRDGSAAGGETTVAPTPTGNGPGPTTAAPHSAGTPQTALLPPAPVAPPPPTAEQVGPPPVVTRQWPRYEAPTQTNPTAPRVSSPPSMSFAPKPVTPPQTAMPGTNKGGHHGFF